jgi:hypothetical protein
MSKLLAHNNQMLIKAVLCFMVMASQDLYNKAFWPFKLPLWGSKLVYSSVTNGVNEKAPSSSQEYISYSGNKFYVNGFWGPVQKSFLAIEIITMGVLS